MAFHNTHFWRRRALEAALVSLILSIWGRFSHGRQSSALARALGSYGPYQWSSHDHVFTNSQTRREAEAHPLKVDQCPRLAICYTPNRRLTFRLNIMALLDDSSPIYTVHLGLFDYHASRERGGRY